MGQRRSSNDVCVTSASTPTAARQQTFRQFPLVPILLQKSFCTGGRKFCGLPVRLSCKNAGGLIPSRETKPASDFANTSEAIRIGDCFLFDSFAKNSSPCNFRLLQQYLPIGDVHPVCGFDERVGLLIGWRYDRHPIS